MYAWMEYLNQVLNFEKTIAKLDSLKKKVLLISGDEDHCFIRGAKEIAQNIKMAKMKIIEHCGHVCSIEKALSFNQMAMSYLMAA